MKTFRMMNNTSHYATSFGMSPKKQADSEILNYKGFHQLSIVQVLKPEVLRILDQWLKINDVDEFKRRIYTTIRDMFTAIKNQAAPISVVGHEFNWKTYDDSLKAPRFDKLIEKHKAKKYFNNGNQLNKTFDSINTT